MVKHTGDELATVPGTSLSNGEDLLLCKALLASTRLAIRLLHLLVGGVKVEVLSRRGIFEFCGSGVAGVHLPEVGCGRC
jgi:hypothetical protein